MWAVTAPHGQNPSAPLCAPLSLCALLCLSSLALALLPTSCQHAWHVACRHMLANMGVLGACVQCVARVPTSHMPHGLANQTNPVRRTRVALGQSLTH